MLTSQSRQKWVKEILRRFKSINICSLPRCIYQYCNFNPYLKEEFRHFKQRYLNFLYNSKNVRKLYKDENYKEDQLFSDMTGSSNARVIETVISNIMHTQFSELELKDQKLNKNIQNLQKNNDDKRENDRKKYSEVIYISLGEK